MTKELQTIPFNEFSHNLTSLVEQVIRENTQVIVENDKGERILVKPLEERKTKLSKKAKADHAAFLASAGGWKDMQDLDSKQLLKNIYEGRNTNLRPAVDL